LYLIVPSENVSRCENKEVSKFISQIAPPEKVCPRFFRRFPRGRETVGNFLMQFSKQIL
jgi:hypothetical protein